jgi:hypothetical protein
MGFLPLLQRAGVIITQIFQECLIKFGGILWYKGTIFTWKARRSIEKIDEQYFSHHPNK